MYHHRNVYPSLLGVQQSLLPVHPLHTRQQARFINQQDEYLRLTFLALPERINAFFDYCIS